MTEVRNGEFGMRNDSDDFLDFEPGDCETPAGGMVAPDVVRLFLRRFAARGDVYARRWFDARKDRGGYWPVREPLDARVAEAHLLGRTTVGQYVLHPDDTVSFAALDLDPTAAALEETRLGDASAGPLALGPMRDYALRLLRAASEASLTALSEETGGDGVHLWWFFAPRARGAPVTRRGRPRTAL
jgi:hypothetical protein